MKICYLNGDKAGQFLDLPPEGITIGRETDNTIQLLIGGVSRYHAKIEYAGNHWILRDLGSTNGTLLNNTRLSMPALLKDGDHLVIGDQHFRMTDENAPAAASFYSGNAAEIPQTGSAVQTASSQTSVQPQPAAPSPEQSQPTSSQTSVQPQPAAPSPEPPKQEAPSQAQPAFVFNPNMSIPAPDFSSESPAPAPEKPEVPQEPAPEKPEPRPLPPTDPDSAPIPVPAKKDAASSAFDGNFFKQSGDESTSGIFQQKSSGKSGALRGNLIFAAVLITMLIIGAALIFRMIQKDKKASDPVGNESAGQIIKQNPFFFYYERQKVSPDTNNIFKFKVHGEIGYDDRVLKVLEDGTKRPARRFYVTVTLDDLESARHFTKKFGIEARIPREKINALQKDLAESGFMRIKQTGSGTIGGNPNFERIVVGYEDQLNDVVFYDGGGENNTYFSKAVELIDQFIDDACSLPNLRNTKEEILDQAQRAYTSAQSAYENYENNPSDLYRAIAAYSRAEKLYFQFRDKPKEYQTVVSRLAELRDVKRKKYTEGISLVNQYQEQGDLDKALRECEKRMQFFTKDSPEYDKFRDQKIRIEMFRNDRIQGKGK